MLQVLDPPPGEGSPLDRQAAAGPALFAVEYALAELWRSWGIEPAAALGQGPGELVAACVAGQMRPEEALKLLAQRAHDVHGAPRDGEMAAVYGAKPSSGAEPLRARLPLAEGLHQLRVRSAKCSSSSVPAKTSWRSRGGA